MKLVIQRVARAAVEVEEKIVGSIGPGLLILLGIEQGDTVEQARQLAAKVAKIRLWPDLKDPSRQWASSVIDNEFEMLVVSQFTLFATFKKPKPDFHQAMGGDEATGLYEAFVERCRAETSPSRVATGVFGALMQVDLRNDGPVTVELTSAPPARASDGQENAKAAPSRPAGEPSEPKRAQARAPGDDLEALLEHQPYVAGFLPSAADNERFRKMRASGVGLPRTPNLARWYGHIASFPDCQRSGWP